jgi:hypothetical protein
LVLKRQEYSTLQAHLQTQHRPLSDHLFNYSGGALFASLKDASQVEKKHAFDLIAQKLVRIVAPCIIFMIINYRSIIRLGQSGDVSDVTFSLALLFLIISFTEFFFILYEQFYIIEEAADKLLVFKLFEVAIFYGLVTLSPAESQVATLISIIFIRILSFAVIAVNAYYNWKIIPSFKTNHRLVVFSIIVSLIVAYFFISTPTDRYNKSLASQNRAIHTQFKFTICN